MTNYTSVIKYLDRHLSLLLFIGRNRREFSNAEFTRRHNSVFADRLVVFLDERQRNRLFPRRVKRREAACTHAVKTFPSEVRAIYRFDHYLVMIEVGR